MSLNTIPSLESWEDINDMDIGYAYEHFGGKSNSEMHQEYTKNICERTGNLRWMPRVPFQYYMIGYRDFINSGKFRDLDKPDAAAIYLNLIEEKLSQTPSWLNLIWDDLYPLAQFLVNNQKNFEADIDIYGNFKEQLSRIETLAKQANLKVD